MKHVPHTYTVEWACSSLYGYSSLRAKEEALVDYHRHEPVAGTSGPTGIRSNGSASNIPSVHTGFFPLLAGDNTNPYNKKAAESYC